MSTASPDKDALVADAFCRLPVATLAAIGRDLTGEHRAALLAAIGEAAMGMGEAAPPARRATRAPEAPPRRRRPKGKKRAPSEIATEAERVYLHIKANPGCSREQIDKALGYADNEASLLLKGLIRQGKVHTTGKKRGTRYFVK